MQQKLKDLILLVKHERKWQLLLGGLVVIIILGSVVDHQPRRYGALDQEESGTVATSADNASDELLEFSIKQKEELEARAKRKDVIILWTVGPTIVAGGIALLTYLVIFLKGL